MMKQDLYKASRQSLQQDVDELKALVFDLKDNDVKHLGERLAKVEGSLRIVLIMVSAILGSGLVSGIVMITIRLLS